MNLSFDHAEKVQIINFQDQQVTELDCTKVIAPEFSNTVTGNKTEDKKDITTNVIRQADKLSLSGFISNMEPDFFLDFATDAGLAAVGALAGSAAMGAAGLVLNREPGYRASEICQRILEMLDSRQPVTITSNIFIMENMLITGFNPVQNKEAMDGVMFTLNLTQIRWVTSKTTDIQLKKLSPAGKKSSLKQAAKKDLGLQSTVPAGDSAKSALKSLMEGLF